MNIIKASFAQLEDVAILFNEYRIFYQQQSDLDRAKKFIKARLENQDSIIFMAVEGKEALGFAQLYPSFTSVGTNRIYILNDLYVKSASRGTGVGRALMQAAKKFAKEQGAVKLVLQTEKSNHAGRTLYESEGFKLDGDFLIYELRL